MHSSAQKIIQYFVDLTANNYSFIHFNSLGFLRLARKTDDVLREIDCLFNHIEKSGGNILVPAYSYSFTANEVYSIEHSKCTLGPVFDYLRQNNFLKRTYDGIFSYLAFSQNISKKYFLPQDYACFGEGSIIDEAFKKNGNIMSVGRKLYFSTEIHYIEKLLNVSYRFDKKFKGKLIAPDGQEFSQTINYFCRDMDFFNRHNVTVSAVQLIEDMQEAGLIKNRVIDDNFLVQSAKLQDVLNFVEPKLKKNILYLTEPYQIST